MGLGLRWDFLDELMERISSGDLDGEIPFLELCPENYMRRGGHIPQSLEYVAEHVPIITHGLMMSLGGTDPFDEAYMRSLADFLERFGAPWHSDHLCFSGVDGRILHDLLPMPQTEAAARHTARRIREAQDRLGVPMAIENISYYVHPGRADLSEPEFVSSVLEQADCKLLLDVNNIYVNSLNHGFDPYEWLAAIDLDRVVQLHVAGHEYRPDDGLYVDTHGAPVLDPVYRMLTWVIARTGPKPVILERDNDVPELEVLLAERRQLEQAYERGLDRYRERQSAPRLQYRVAPGEPGAAVRGA